FSQEMALAKTRAPGTSLTGTVHNKLLLGKRFAVSAPQFCSRLQIGLRVLFWSPARSQPMATPRKRATWPFPWHSLTIEYCLWMRIYAPPLSINYLASIEALAWSAI